MNKKTEQIINIPKSFEKIAALDDRVFKNIFRSEIRGSFLINIKSCVVKELGPIAFRLYDFHLTDEKMLTGIDNNAEYEICKMIVGVHHANTIFKTKEERSALEKSQEYKDQITKQVAENVLLRFYAGSFFRNKELFAGERFIYYPVPYLLFVLCARMNKLFGENGVGSPSAFWISQIMIKALASLTLLEDNFLDSSYMPCRTVIEIFVKLLLFWRHPKLFETAAMFADFDLDKTCCSQTYSAEFESLYAKRKSKKTNRAEYMHFGFVDGVEDYHAVVEHAPYSINGILTYLLHDADANTSLFLGSIKRLHTMCHGYAHGNVVLAKYPLLHYFEISMILGEIVPKAYVMLCNEMQVDTSIPTCDGSCDVLSRFDDEFLLLKEQYRMRSSENFDLERDKTKG